MNMKSLLGVDCWQLQDSFVRFLQKAQACGVELYDLFEEEGMIRVCTPLHQRMAFRHYFPHAVLVDTNGIAGFFLRNIVRPSRCLSLLLSVAVWIGLSKFTFVADIQGDSLLMKEEIQECLTQAYGSFPVFLLNEENVETLLEDQLSSSLVWVESKTEGSRLKVRFASRPAIEMESLGDADLIAQRDGVIAGFDLQHGNKCVQINDVVKKGDVLVSSVLIDSFQKEKHVFVKGRVFAYTWETVEVSCQKDALPRPFQFFKLLLKAREEVSKDFLKDDRIEKENILQFEEKAGTIRMKIHYTIYRDISSPV